MGMFDRAGQFFRGLFKKKASRLEIDPVQRKIVGSVSCRKRGDGRYNAMGRWLSFYDIRLLAMPRWIGKGKKRRRVAMDLRMLAGYRK